MYISENSPVIYLLLLGVVFLANVFPVSALGGDQDSDYSADIYIPVPKYIGIADSVFLDNNDNRWNAVKISGGIKNRWDLAADLSYWKLDEPQSVIGIPDDQPEEPLTGYRGTVKAGIKATNRINLAGELGFYDWLDQDAGWKGSLSSIAIIGRGSLTLRLHKDQLLELDSSYDALVEEIEYKAVDLTLWTALGNQSAFYGSASVAALNDDNSRASTYMSLTTQPWGTHRINVGIDLFAVGFSDPSVLYWSPELDGTLSLIADAVYPVMPSWEIKVGGTFGHAFTKQDIDIGFDNSSYSLLIVSEWNVNNYIIALEGSENRSLSDSPYESRVLIISLRRNF